MTHDSLETRILGSGGPALTRVGFGAWAIGGGAWAYGWGPQDDAASLRAMRHAVDRGINWIDTAAVYGLGHSEELVGRLLRELPQSQRPLVFTKCGLRWNIAEPMAEPQRNLRPASIREEVDASLRRLGVERIDLYQCHWPDELGTPVEDSWGEMLRLVAEGKVRWAGVSNFDVAMLDRCAALGPVQSLQPGFNLIWRGPAGDVLPWCARRGTGVIVYSPMHSGLLTDRWTVERADTLHADDWRRRAREFQRPLVERNLALRDALQPIARRHGSSVGAVAVAWTLAWPGVTAAIVGARSPEQVDGWLAAGSLELTAAELDEIASAIQRTGAGSGPTRPTGRG